MPNPFTDVSRMAGVPGAIDVDDDGPVTGGGGGSPTGPVEDAFASPTGSIDGRTPVPTDNTDTWAATGVSIVSGHAEFTANGDGAHIEYGFNDQGIEAKFLASGADNRAIVVCRGTYGANDAIPTTGYYAHFDTNAGDITLGRYAAGSPTTITSSAETINNAIQYTLGISCSGTALKVYLDNVEIISTTDGNVTTGTACGFAHLDYASGGGELDDFTANTPESLVPSVSGAINDEFASPTGSIDGRTPVPTDNGSVWSATGAAITVIGEVQLGTSGDGANIQYGLDAQGVECVYHPQNADNRMSLIARAAYGAENGRPTTGYALNFRTGESIIRLAEYTSTSASTLIDYTVPGGINNAQAYRIGLSCNGTAIKAYLDQQEIISTTDSTHTAGLRCGFVHFLFNASGGSVDSFVADTPASLVITPGVPSIAVVSGDNVVFDTEPNPTITGQFFGGSATGSARVRITEMADGTGTEVVQSLTGVAWSDTQITLAELDLTGLASNAYVFVRDSAGNENATGHAVIISTPGTQSGRATQGLGILSANRVEEDIKGLATSGLAGPTGGAHVVGDFRVPVFKTYNVVNSVQLVFNDVGQGATYEVLDYANTGPRIKIYDNANALFDANVNVFVRGI